MSDDPFPDHPTFEELDEMLTAMEEFDDISNFSEANGEWYNEAPYVAARLMVETAREHDEFRQRLVEADEGGVALSMDEYDEERGKKLNSIGLSMFQGTTAERLARSKLTEGDGA